MVPMIIIVRVGLGLAYQGASSTPSHQPNRDYNHHNDDPTSTAPQASSGRGNNAQLATFQAAVAEISPQEDDVLENMGLESTSSEIKLDITRSSSVGADSRVVENYTETSGNSGEGNGKKLEG